MVRPGKMEMNSYSHKLRNLLPPTIPHSNQFMMRPSEFIIIVGFSMQRTIQVILIPTYIRSRPLVLLTCLHTHNTFFSWRYGNGIHW